MQVNTADIQSNFDEIYSRAKMDKVKNKLTTIHSVMTELIKKRKQLPEITDLVINLNRNNLVISERTFYNKRGGNNLYRELYDAWARHIMTPLAVKTSTLPLRDKTKLPLAILKIEDLKEIQSESLKYRITLALQQLANTANQLDMLKNSVTQASKVSPLNDPRNTSAPRNKFELDRYELDTLKQFLNDGFETYFNADGALIAKKNIRIETPLSRPGLKSLLTKVCRTK